MAAQRERARESERAQAVRCVSVGVSGYLCMCVCAICLPCAGAKRALNLCLFVCGAQPHTHTRSHTHGRTHRPNELLFLRVLRAAVGEATELRCSENDTATQSQRVKNNVCDATRRRRCCCCCCQCRCGALSLLLLALPACACACMCV